MRLKRHQQLALLVFTLAVSSFIILAVYFPDPPPTPPLPEKTDPKPTTPQEPPSLIETIKQEEGFRAKTYQDSEGVLTIGYGMNLSEGITRAEADWILRSRLDHATHCLERNWKPYYRMQQWTRDALSDMAYQLGCAGVLRFKKMLSALDQGECAAAQDQALDSDWSRETPARAHRVVTRLCPPSSNP